MQESLITAIENNDIEQLKALLEIITDVEKANAVVYSAYLGKIEPLELLIEAGAVLDRPDTEGHTALYWAKERDHQAIIHLFHQHGAREEHISATTMALLKTVGLKQADLTALGIKLEDIERSANLRFLGQCLRFLVSVSLIKTFMLWPFMQRGGINLDEEREQETNAGTQPNRPNKNKQERLSFSDVSESEDARLLSANEFNDTEEEREHDDDIVIKNEADTDDKNEWRDQAVILEKEVESHLAEGRKHQRKTCSAPVFTSSALLFESEPILKTVAAINAFHETVDTLISSVWNAFLSSLIINGLINYALYPEERAEADLLDAFGITGLRNFGCITSIKAIKDSFLCSSSYKKGYDDVLSSSLSSYYIWPFIAGIPVLFGMINAIRASWNMKALHKQDVKALIQQLKEYKPGFWADGLGWIFTAAVPDLFPPAAILFMLPQPAIKNALEKIRQTIIWDGRLSAKDRQKLFNHLNRFAQQRSQFTQMKALSILADIVDGINFKNLAILKEEGVEDETIKTLTIIKTKALKELEFLANHYNLPDAPKSLFRPLFRYIYVNYLMWNLGYPQQAALQPLFFAAKALKLYYTLIFYKAIIGGVIEMINDYLEKKQCLEAGNEWTYFQILDEWQCTVCEDFGFYYQNIFTTKDCVREYLAKHQLFNDTMENIVRRSQKKNSWGIDRNFNLSEVTSLTLDVRIYDHFSRSDSYTFRGGELAILLSSLKHKMINLQEFKLTYYASFSNIFDHLVLSDLEVSDLEAIGQFIQNSSIKTFHPVIPYTEESLKILSKFLPGTTIENFYFSSIAACDRIKFNFTTPAQSLKYSEVKRLFIEPSCLNHASPLSKAIFDILPDSNIVEISLTLMEYDTLCFLAEKLPVSRVQILTLNTGSLMEPLPGNPVCANIFLEALTHIKKDFYFTLKTTGIPDLIMNKLTRVLSYTSLKKLHVDSDFYLSENDMGALFQAISKSQLEDLVIHLPTGLNYSLVIPQLADAIDRLAIKNFVLYCPYGGNRVNSSEFVEGFNFIETKLFISLLRTKLKKITALGFQVGSSSAHSPENIGALFEALPFTNIQWLSMTSQYIGSKLAVLGKSLPKTKLRTLYTDSVGNVTDDDLAYFAKKLNQSKIEALTLGKNNIGDKGIKALFEGIQGSSLKSIAILLNDGSITDEGAKAIAQALTPKLKSPLWIDFINLAKQTLAIRTMLSATLMSNLTSLTIVGTHIGDEGAQALCNMLPQTNIARIDFWSANISEYMRNNCGVFLDPPSSSSNALCPMGPYFLLYRVYQAIHQFLYAVWYKAPSKLGGDHLQQTADEPMPFADFSKRAVSMIDASHYLHNDTVVVDLNSHDAVAARGSIYTNNILIGNDDSLLDVSQSSRTNFIQPGKNNILRLGFFSQDHIVIQEEQGTIRVQGFESKDTLHLVAETAVYGQPNITICQNKVIENDTNFAVIHLKGTTIQLVNTHCEDIENAIKINDPESMNEAQREVFNPSENHSSVLYTSLLSICETFLGAVHKSALLTAIPVFAAEILYRSGGYTRQEVERFSEEIQKLLVLSFADSSHVMAASVLASWLATKLTNSPTIISTVGLGASIVASVASTALSANVPLSWMALQTGVALMGSVVGSYSVRWGLNKASSAKDYLHNKLNFWSNQPERDSRQAHYYDTNFTIAYR